MTQKDMERLKELRLKPTLTEKEEAQWKFLERKAENDERIEQFRKNQREPYSSKRSRAANLAWEFYKNVEIDGQCYVAVGGLPASTFSAALDWNHTCAVVSSTGSCAPATADSANSFASASRTMYQSPIFSR